MAESRLSQDQFICPVCLELLKNPVAIPCGHSYCMSCITDYWDHEDQKRVYSCPQCRQAFSPRPALNKNTMLAEVVEQLKKTEHRTAVPAGDGDVECDVCTGRKNKAIKSCLVCLNSYCQNHLEQHENLFKAKRHNLIDATGQLQEMICHKHDKLLEIYCRTDQRCVCMLCMVDEHKDHETVSTSAERTEKQKQLAEIQGKFQQQIQEREMKLQELKEAVKIHERSAQTAVKDSERVFSEFIRSIDRKRSEVTQIIRDREKITVSCAEGLLNQLQHEIDDLRRKNAKLEQLSNKHDHICFIQSFASLPVPPASLDVPSITVSSYDEIGKSVYQLTQKLEDFCKVEIEKISGQVTCIQIIPTPEYESRNDFLQYFCHLTLDPNTAHQNLRLSEKSRAVIVSSRQNYPDHPDRFDQCHQVLCRESVRGRCYWEVEWSGNSHIFISVSYKSINRKEERGDCRFGSSDKSWGLTCSRSRCSFRHSNVKTDLAVVPSNRIGVYVDHSAGILSFYSVSDTMTLIHRVHTSFTQPLYPGFGFIHSFLRSIELAFGKFPAKNETLKLCDI